MMERYFDEHHVAVRDMVRDFAQSEIRPVAGELDRSAEFPWENVKKMAELGLFGIPWPEELRRCRDGRHQLHDRHSRACES